jgi:transposase InsO family protein
LQSCFRNRKKDPTLKLCWDQAADPLTTTFIVKDKILYAIDPDPKQLENPYKVVVPQSLRSKVLDVGHACSGHFGSRKTRAHVQSHFYWPGMGKDISTHCKACTTCASFTSHRKSIQPLQPVPIVHTPWEKLAMDIVGPFTRTTSGYKYVLTLVDMATRFPEAIPLKKVDTASTAEALLKVFSAYGTPSCIVHDNGSNFTSELMTNILKSLNISQIRVSPYHPQANGMIERLNGTLKKAIKKAGATESTWDRWLHFVLHAVRITNHAATGHTPYELEA